MRNRCVSFIVKEYSNLIANLNYNCMKRYPNTTILASLMLVLVSAIGVLTLVSFKNKATRFKVPYIISKDGTNVCIASNSIQKAAHSIERVEEFNDTLNLCNNNSPDKYYEFTYTTVPQPSYISNSGLKLIVDTTHELHQAKSLTSVGYPVYIINRSNSKTMRVETKDDNLLMVIEALSTKNTWEPIEYTPEKHMGLDYMCIQVPPHHYLFTSSIKYTGDFNTKCRLKLVSNDEVFYSNEFYMGISLTQFQQS